MNETLTLPAYNADDSRRKALMAFLLSKETEVEHKLCARTFARFQMHIICPLAILAELRREGQEGKQGKVNYFVLQRELQEKHNNQVSEVEFQKAWLGVEELFRKFEMTHPVRMVASA